MFAWYRSLKITLKLRVAFAVLAALTVIVGLFGLGSMSLLKGRMDTAYRQDLPSVSAIKEAGLSQLKAMRVLLRVVLAAGDNDEISRLNVELGQDLAHERQQLNLCKTKLRSADGLAQLMAAEKLMPKFEKGAADIVTSAKAGDVVGFRSTILDLVPVSDQIQHVFDQVSNITESQASRSQMLGTGTYWSALTLMAPLVIFAAVLAGLMSFIMSSVIAKPLARMVDVLELVAQGDLTQTLPESDTNENGRVGRSLNRALASIRETLHHVSISARELKGASDNISTTASTLVEGSSAQAASLESTSSSLEEISANIRSTADHTSVASQLGTSARDAAGKGDASVSSTICAMDEIKASSEAITAILSAIEELAFQSNLLAINASIEAARAGESGRSFVVVATEMRYLADRSKQAGKDIARLIEQSLERVSKGEKLVHESGLALTEIMSSVGNLSTTVHEIDQACNQQSQGVEHVAQAMTEVERVLQNNIARTENLSATAEQLSSMAMSLSDSLSHFKFEGETAAAETYKEEFGDPVGAAKRWAQTLASGGKAAAVSARNDS